MVHPKGFELRPLVPAITLYPVELRTHIVPLLPIVAVDAAYRLRSFRAQPVCHPHAD